ncbi:hypothetical protein Bca101_084370 [Brassica carinata]
MSKSKRQASRELSPRSGNTSNDQQPSKEQGVDRSPVAAPGSIPPVEPASESSSERPPVAASETVSEEVISKELDKVISSDHDVPPASPPTISLDRQLGLPPSEMETTTPETQPKSQSQTGGGSHRIPPGREDWWSEDATATLIEAWGDRYVHLSRGNLRQSDWKEVADAVNSRHGGTGRPKTDVQCKNRIDTLKKKYKTEKAKRPSPSSWCFFERLDFLIGPVAAKKSAGAGVFRSVSTKPAGSVSSGSSLDDDDDDDDDDDVEGGWGFVARKHRRVEDVVDRSVGEGEGSSSCRELARAILKLGEAYERIEGAKQGMMIELEKQRMEAAKELELQRMNMLMDMQMELEKSKLGKRRAAAAAASGKKL